MCVSGTSGTSCCGGIFDDMQGSILSFNYPYPYWSCNGCDFNCLNTIKAPAGSMISLAINEFEVDSYHETVKVLDVVDTVGNPNFVYRYLQDFKNFAQTCISSIYVSVPVSLYILSMCLHIYVYANRPICRFLLIINCLQNHEKG